MAPCLTGAQAMVITESELREMWRDGRNPLPPFPPGTRFTPAAQDFLKTYQLEIHFATPPASDFGPPTSDLRLRGRLDTLHALVMLVAAEARRYQLPRLAACLDTLAAHCQEIQSAEYQGREVQPLAVAGKTEAEIHEISHWPDKYLGIAHIVPGAHDHAILHWLNHLRTAAREVEVFALEVYPPPERADLSHALNRVSSAVYYLELLFKAGTLGWEAAA